MPVGIVTRTRSSAREKKSKSIAASCNSEFRPPPKTHGWFPCRDCWYVEAFRCDSLQRSISFEQRWNKFFSCAFEIPMTSRLGFVVSDAARRSISTQTKTLYRIRAPVRIVGIRMCPQHIYNFSHNVRLAHWLRCDYTRCLTHFSGRRQYNNRNVICCLQWAAVWSFFERSSIGLWLSCFAAQQCRCCLQLITRLSFEKLITSTLQLWNKYFVWIYVASTSTHSQRSTEP